jgi:outer membrane protein TolC
MMGRRFAALANRVRKPVRHYTDRHGYKSRWFHPWLSVRIRGIVVVLAVLSAFHSVAAVAQQAPESAPLNLQQAVKIALEKNPLRKAALADRKVASADVGAARSYLMPRLMVSETATRGNDPVYVFGSRLRQQRFTAGNFALNALNRPTPIGNFTTRFGGNWNLFDSFATRHRVTAAKQMDQAAEQQLNRTDQEIEFRVISAYHTVLLAAKQAEVAQQSIKTAQSTLDRSQGRFSSGLVVESDLLSAKVRMAARQQELIEAQHKLELAQAQLNTAMGVAADSRFQLDQTLSEHALPTPGLEDLEKQALARRPDLKRIDLEQSAQRQAVSAARSSFGPRLNAFAGWEMDNPTLLAGGGGNNWVGGLEIQFDLFQGGAKRAELSRQRALQEKVAAMKQAAMDGVRLEVRQAYYQFDASRQQIEVARAAVSQAQESLRINQDRYDGGLITVTELLTADEAARRSQTDYWQAVSSMQTSYANLELACGTLSPQSIAVMP